MKRMHIIKTLVRKEKNKFLILTGHKDGSIWLWKLYEYQSTLINYKDEITCMNFCQGGQIVFCTFRGFIYIWDSCLITCLKIIE